MHTLLLGLLWNIQFFLFPMFFLYKNKHIVGIFFNNTNEICVFSKGSLVRSLCKDPLFTLLSETGVFVCYVTCFSLTIFFCKMVFARIFFWPGRREGEIARRNPTPRCLNVGGRGEDTPRQRWWWPRSTGSC